ncbi:MAG: SET domain-containing protein-lysine N-methyltransferase [Candidatus Dormibacteraeota bacterium]|nr:SET domain-containing protein-lysine N-methyltransferase [Candidatus Dormibacteraeota bacterium]
MNGDLEVRPSGIGGRGLFTRRAFPRGERIPIPRTGRWAEMTDDDFRRFISGATSWDAVYLGEGRHLVSLTPRQESPANYGNHSCEPNTAPLDPRQGDRVALRDIAAGEELTVDYAPLSPLGWEMPCNCGAPGCRGVVRGTLK